MTYFDSLYGSDFIISDPSTHWSFQVVVNHILPPQSTMEMCLAAIGFESRTTPIQIIDIKKCAIMFPGYFARPYLLQFLIMKSNQVASKTNWFEEDAMNVVRTGYLSL